MAVTRTWDGTVALNPARMLKPAVPVQRRRELPWLAGSSIVVLSAILLILSAKMESFAETEARLRDGAILNLNDVRNSDQLIPFLEMVGYRSNAGVGAQEIMERIERSGSLRNVGALRTELRNWLPRLKPFFVVRTPREFRRQFAISLMLYFLSFYAVHLAWRWRRFTGDGVILPILHMLTGIGFSIAFSLRDPLRDTLEFSKFAVGVAIGCSLLLLPLFRFFDYRRYANWIYVPLISAFALLALLFAFGSGPTGNDSKVNLGPVQPMEGIKVLLVLFLAGYFANRWEWLRELRERNLPKSLRWLNLPRFSHALPVMVAVGSSLLVFFWLKDLGPALVIAALFLAMFGIARNHSGLALTGILFVVIGVSFGYRLGTPATVAGRISMWLSPWNNDVRGGDQLVHATWAFATGGPFGSGPGRGDPAMIPAGHTDLVLPAFAEEWGLPGVFAVAILFALLYRRSVRIALAAPDDYGVFLGLGLCALIATEMLLVSAGVLGAIPLTGIVSPFLSSGNSAMIANFLVFAVILNISARTSVKPAGDPFRRPVRVLSMLLGACGVALLAKAAAIQVISDDELLARDVMVYQADGVKRAQHNPRLNSLAQSLQRGTIYDRNGVVLASSGFAGRQYPFAHETAHLLGDARTGENFAASNSSLIEDDYNANLRGFSNYGELAALVRYRHQPNHPDIEALRIRSRDLRVSIDIRLQQRAVEILERRLSITGKRSGALVVLDADSGDVLALASAPAPRYERPSQPDELLDRARYGQYPPGSTFKLVTAMAALRKEPKAQQHRYACRSVGHGRVGVRIPGWNRPIRDDAGDVAHGMPAMAHALTVSCNAYFAQLGVFAAGAPALLETAELLEIPAGDLTDLKRTLPYSSMGQGTVLMTPFKLARVAATIASGGLMPQGRWVLDDANSRVDAPRRVLSEAQAHFLAEAMRSVVAVGTGRRAMAGLNVQVAGKTGTAQTDDGEPHSWFTGFVPYDAPASQRLAFAVVVEHGGYGARAAAPIARELVDAARDLGLIHKR